MLLHHQLIQWLEAVDWNTFLGAAFGSVLSFGFAWWLLHYQIKHERKQEQLKEERKRHALARENDEHQRQLFRYTTSLLKRASEGWTDSVDSHREFIKSLHADPFGMPGHPVSINSAQRSLDRVDRQELLTCMTHVMGQEAGEKAHRDLVRAVDYFTEQRDLSLAAIESQKQDIDRGLKYLNELVVSMTNELRAWLYDHPGALDPLSQQIALVWNGLRGRPGGVEEMPIDAVLNELVHPIQRIGDGLGRGQTDLMPLLKMTAEFGSQRNRVVMQVRNLAQFVGDVSALMNDQATKAAQLLTTITQYSTERI